MKPNHKTDGHLLVSDTCHEEVVAFKQEGGSHLVKQSMLFSDKIRDMSAVSAASIIFFCLLTASVTALLLSKDWLSSSTYTSATDPATRIDCGSSTTEARAKGCHVEPMLYGWVPDACFYPSLSANFDALSDRQWYADANMSQPLTSAQIWEAEILHVYTHSYHTEHCLFLWRKLGWAIENKMAYVDNKTLDLDHTNHCSDLISHGRERSDGVNDVVLGFYECKRLQWGPE